MSYEIFVENVRLFVQRRDKLFLKTGATCPLDHLLQWCELGPSQGRFLSLIGSDAYGVVGATTMSRPMGLLEQEKGVDNMLAEVQAEGNYRAMVSASSICTRVKMPV